MESPHTATGPNSGARLLIHYSTAPPSYEVESDVVVHGEPAQNGAGDIGTRLGELALNGRQPAEAGDVDEAAGVASSSNGASEDSPEKVPASILQRQRAKERHMLIVSYMVSQTDETGRLEGLNTSAIIREALGFEKDEGANDFAILKRLGILTVEKERPSSKRFSALTVHRGKVDAAIESGHLLPIQDVSEYLQARETATTDNGQADPTELHDGDTVQIQPSRTEREHQVSSRVRKEIEREAASGAEQRQPRRRRARRSPAKRAARSSPENRRSQIQERTPDRSVENDTALSENLSKSEHPLTPEEVSKLPNELYYMVALLSEPLIKSSRTFELFNHELFEVTGLEKQTRKDLNIALIRRELIAFNREGGFSLRLTKKGSEYLKEKIDAMQMQPKTAATL